MTADNRRKEEQSKAKAENSGECPVSSLSSTMADKAARNDFFLPSNERNAHIATIEGVISAAFSVISIVGLGVKSEG